MKNLLVGYKYAKLFAADQCLCFHYTDSTISLYPKSEIASLLPSPVALQLGLCPTWLETRKTGFLAMHLSCIESVLMLQWKSLRKMLMDGLCMSHYAFTSPMSLTGPEEQTKYACLFSAVGRMSSLVFRNLHVLSLG